MSEAQRDRTVVLTARALPGVRDAELWGAGPVCKKPERGEVVPHKLLPIKTVTRTRSLYHMPGDYSVKKHKVGCPPRHKVPK